MSAPTVAEMVAAMDGWKGPLAANIRTALLRAERIAPFVQHRAECAARRCGYMLGAGTTICNTKEGPDHYDYQHPFTPRECDPEKCGLDAARGETE